MGAPVVFLTRNNATTTSPSVDEYAFQLLAYTRAFFPG